jgi:hypothetical protein
LVSAWHHNDLREVTLSSELPVAEVITKVVRRRSVQSIHSVLFSECMPAAEPLLGLALLVTENRVGSVVQPAIVYVVPPSTGSDRHKHNARAIEAFHRLRTSADARAHVSNVYQVAYQALSRLVTQAVGDRMAAAGMIFGRRKAG